MDYRNVADTSCGGPPFCYRPLEGSPAPRVPSRGFTARSAMSGVENDRKPDENIYSADFHRPHRDALKSGGESGTFARPTF